MCDIDMSQFKDMFLAESRSLLLSVDRHLAAVQAAPGDPQALTELYRVAHTLKSMYGMMGMDEAMSLSRELSRTLDLMKKGTLYGAGPAAAVSGGFDALKAVTGLAPSEGGAAPAIDEALRILNAAAHPESDEERMVRELFFSEGREHLQTMTACLIRLTSDPGDLEALRELYRAVHTLKGMAATMDFRCMTSVCSAMSDVLYGAAERKAAVPDGLLRVLPGCVTCLVMLLNDLSVCSGEVKRPEVERCLEQLRSLGGTQEG